MASGKCALITGGSHGIGRGVALTLASRGYDVAFTYNHRESDAREVAARIEGLGVRAIAIQADLSDPKVPAQATRDAIAALGGLDVALMNAGVTRFSSILNITNRDIDELFNLNFRAYLLCAREAARAMVKAGTRGSILFTASSRGQRAYPEDMLYGGLKAAIIRASQSMALDLSPYGIRVNCIAPGATSITPDWEGGESRLDSLIPLGRLGTAREVGEAVAYLAEAQYITGVTLRLDGGLILPGSPESMPEKSQWLNPDWVKKQRAAADQPAED